MHNSLATAMVVRVAAFAAAFSAYKVTEILNMTASKKRQVKRPNAPRFLLNIQRNVSRCCDCFLVD
jgi:hypothetical protein